MKLKAQCNCLIMRELIYVVPVLLSMGAGSESESSLRENDMTLQLKQVTIALAAAGMIGVAAPAVAGNIFLTGHDNDFHQSTAAKAAMTAAITFVKDGSTLPVLTFDAGSELTSLLTSLGIAFTNIDPSNAANVTASLFDHSVYSAFVVASVTSCGGCDNSPAAVSNIAAQSAAIATFFNAGGGIIGLAGASDASAYAYVPEAATNAGGSPPSTGYVQTAQGATLGLPAVNGDTTHNFFSEPGTGGLSSAFVVTERLGDAATGIPESIALAHGTIVCTGPSCTIGGGTVPEPGTLMLLSLGLGVLGLGAAGRGRRAS